MEDIRREQLLSLVERLAKAGVLLEESQGAIEGLIIAGRYSEVERRLLEAVDEALTIEDLLSDDQAREFYKDLSPGRPGTTTPTAFQQGYVGGGNE